MPTTTPAPDTPATPRPVCTIIAGGCPLLLLGLYLFLASGRGTRMYDAFAMRNYGNGLVAFGLLIVVFGGTMILGLVMGAWALARRERPAWLARAILAVNALLALAALAAIN